MASYQSLKQLFHQTRENAAAVVCEELHRRRQHPAALHYPYYVADAQLFCVLTQELHLLTEEIWRRELVIAKLWGRLPQAAQQQYLYALLTAEIQATNEIEQISSTRKEIDIALQLALQKRESVDFAGKQQLVEMARTYLLLFAEPAAELEMPQQKIPHSLAELRSLYDALLGAEIAERDRPDGKLFRAKAVALWDGVSQQPIHQGVESEAEIVANLRVLLAVMNRVQPGFAGQPASLIDVFIAHFIFEHTHPFYDGNGRFGRFLMSLQLRELLSAPTAISLSAQLLEQRQKYYRAFQNLENPLNQAEATFFVADLLKLLAQAQQNLLESLQEKFKHFTQLQERIDYLDAARKQFCTAELVDFSAKRENLSNARENNLSNYQLQALFWLGQVRLFGARTGVNLAKLAEFTGRSKATLRRAMHELVQQGLVQELSRKPLVFALTAAGYELLQIGELSDIADIA